MRIVVSSEQIVNLGLETIARLQGVDLSSTGCWPYADTGHWAHVA